jgi:ribosomal protein L21E
MKTMEVDPMRKFLLSASLFSAGVMLAGASARTQPIAAAPQSNEQQTEKATKSVSGTVVSIGDKGRSFAVEVNDGDKKQTVQFVVDQETQVQGQVKVGTPVKVEYVAKADQNVARTVTPQSQG